jgi:hypothetical protein
VTRTIGRVHVLMSTGWMNWGWDWIGRDAAQCYAREKLKKWKRRVAKPSDCLFCCTNARRLLEDVYTCCIYRGIGENEGLMHEPLIEIRASFSSCWQRQCNAMLVVARNRLGKLEEEVGVAISEKRRCTELGYVDRMCM